MMRLKVIEETKESAANVPVLSYDNPIHKRLLEALETQNSHKFANTLLDVSNDIIKSASALSFADLTLLSRFASKIIRDEDPENPHVREAANRLREAAEIAKGFRPLLLENPHLRN